VVGTGGADLSLTLEVPYYFYKLPNDVNIWSGMPILPFRRRTFLFRTCSRIDKKWKWTTHHNKIHHAFFFKGKQSFQGRGRKNKTLLCTLWIIRFYQHPYFIKTQNQWKILSIFWDLSPLEKKKRNSFKNFTFKRTVLSTSQKVTYTIMRTFFLFLIQIDYKQDGK